MKKFRTILSLIMAIIFVLAMSSIVVIAGANRDFLDGGLDVDSDYYVTAYTEYHPYGVAEINILTGIQLFACYDQYDYVQVDASSGYSRCDAGYDFSGIVNDVEGAYSDHHYGAYGEYYGVFYNQEFF